MHFVSADWFAWMLFTIAFFWLSPLKWRQHVLTLITAAFLGVYAPLSLAILALLSSITYITVASKSKKQLSGFKAFLVIIVDVSILAYYKIQVGEHNNDDIASIVIPLGLAYYTLRLIHYVLEAYKGTLPHHKFNDFLHYLFFLPTIVVGPIHRFAEFNKDLRRHHWDFNMISQGCERILYGYVKITFLANYLISGLFAQYITTCGDATDPIVIYLDMIRVGLNLYMQFSGFSDIAIGFAKILGFNIMENFKWPYFQKNISDFWKCWHISLTSWCREYIFTTVFSISRSPMLGAISTMIIIGVWHELSLRFIVWGIYHGVGITIWQYFQKYKQTLPTLPSQLRPFADALSILLTLHFVWLGFNIVRYPTLGESFEAIKTVLFFWI